MIDFVGLNKRKTDAQNARECKTRKAYIEKNGIILIYYKIYYEKRK